MTCSPALVGSQIEARLAAPDDARGAQESRDRVDQRRLATPALAGDTEDLRTVEVDVDVVDGAHRVLAPPVVDTEVAHVEDALPIGASTCVVSAIGP